MNFSVGDKVTLKEEFKLSNSPREMIVEGIADTEVSVFWFDDTNEKKQGKFSENFLELCVPINAEEIALGFFNDWNNLEEEYPGGSYTF